MSGYGKGKKRALSNSATPIQPGNGSSTQPSGPTNLIISHYFATPNQPATPIQPGNGSSTQPSGPTNLTSHDFATPNRPKNRSSTLSKRETVNNSSGYSTHTPTTQTGANNLEKQLNTIYNNPTQQPPPPLPTYGTANYNNSQIQQSPPPQQAETSNRGKQFYNVKPDVSTRIQQIKEDLDDTYSIEYDDNMIKNSEWDLESDNSDYNSDYDTKENRQGEYDYEINDSVFKIKYTSSRFPFSKPEYPTWRDKTLAKHTTQGQFSVQNTNHPEQKRYYRIENIGTAKESLPDGLPSTTYLPNQKELKTCSHSEPSLMRPMFNVVIPKKVQKLGKNGDPQKVTISLWNSYYAPCDKSYDIAKKRDNSKKVHCHTFLDKSSRYYSNDKHTVTIDVKSKADIMNNKVIKKETTRTYPF